MQRKRLYQVYLIRMWRETPDGEWLTSVQDVSSGECSNFYGLSTMFDHIRTEAEKCTRMEKTVLRQNDGPAQP